MSCVFRCVRCFRFRLFEGSQDHSAQESSPQRLAGPVVPHPATQGTPGTSRQALSALRVSRRGGGGVAVACCLAARKEEVRHGAVLAVVLAVWAVDSLNPTGTELYLRSLRSELSSRSIQSTAQTSLLYPSSRLARTSIDKGGRKRRRMAKSISRSGSVRPAQLGTAEHRPE